MFDLTPFRKGSNDILSVFNDMEKDFMKNFNIGLPHLITDIVDKGDRFILEAELPGFNKEDINIEVDHNRLTISAKHGVSKEDIQENYIRKERRYGSFTRSFDISNIKADDIRAEYINGLLILDLPKKENNPKRKIDIH
ncbi:MAG: Hsp20/alpha crystallin family protein [Firmicutes bacterium]|nr:Hsp20/alpha crystallin family protein [Bacillota bacterium]